MRPAWLPTLEAQGTGEAEAEQPALEIAAEADFEIPHGERKPRIKGYEDLCGQLPIESDPPDQTDYRKLVEPFFLRAKQPEFVARGEDVTDRLLTECRNLYS